MFCVEGLKTTFIIHEVEVHLLYIANSCMKINIAITKSKFLWRVFKFKRYHTPVLLHTSVIHANKQQIAWQYVNNTFLQCTIPHLKL